MLKALLSILLLQSQVRIEHGITSYATGTNLEQASLRLYSYTCTEAALYLINPYFSGSPYEIVVAQIKYYCKV